MAAKEAQTDGSLLIKIEKIQSVSVNEKQSKRSKSKKSSQASLTGKGRSNLLSFCFSFCLSPQKQSSQSVCGSFCLRGQTKDDFFDHQSQGRVLWPAHGLWAMTIKQEKRCKAENCENRIQFQLEKGSMINQTAL